MMTAFGALGLNAGPLETYRLITAIYTCMLQVPMQLRDLRLFERPLSL